MLDTAAEHRGDRLFEHPSLVGEIASCDLRSGEESSRKTPLTVHVVDHLAKEGGQRFVGWIGLQQVVGTIAERSDLALEHGGDQRVAIREVAIERSCPDAGSAGDVLEREIGLFLGEDLARGTKERVPVALCVCAERFGRVHGHLGFDKRRSSPYRPSGDDLRLIILHGGGMRILMFGRGVVAAAYGWALAGAGHDVEFYVRPGRAKSYGDWLDLDILDSRRKGSGRWVRQTWSPRYREELPPEHDFDLIVLSVPHHRLPGAIEFLSTRIGNATVLMLSNMWEEPLDVVAPLPPDQVAWGAPQGGGGYDEAGRLRATLLPAVLFGSFNEALTERELAARAAFGQAGFRVREQADIRGWFLLHTATDAGLFSQALRHGAMADLIGDTAALREAMLVGRELLPVIEARGVDLRRHRTTTLSFRLPSWLPAVALSVATKRVPIVRRAFEAHADPDAEEPRVVCRDVLAKAQRLGVPTPRLSAAAPAFPPGQNR